MEVWKLAPTPDAARKLRPSRVAKVLKQHRIRRIDAPEVLRRLRVRSIPVAPGTTQAMRVHIESLGERLAVVRNQLRDISRELDRLIRAWEKRCESTPGPQGPCRDVAILASLPGVGRIVLATLLSEAFDARRRDYAALRCLCGVAPVTRSSGKYTRVVRRQAVHPRLREAAYHWSAWPRNTTPSAEPSTLPCGSAATAMPGPCGPLPIACWRWPAPCCETRRTMRIMRDSAGLLDPDLDRGTL